MSQIIFTTERLIIRQYEFERDAENFFLLNSDLEIMKYIRAPKPKDECLIFLKQIIEDYSRRPLIGRWAADDKITGEFVGSFAIIPIEGTEDIQLGYALFKNFWGRGYASEMTKAGLEYYFHSTDADHIYAVAEKPNTASHKVLLKNGFVEESIKNEGDKELIRFIYKK